MGQVDLGKDEGCERTGRVAGTSKDPAERNECVSLWAVAILLQSEE